MATSDCVVSFKLLMIGDTNVVRTTVSLISHTYAANSSLSVSVSVFFVSVSVSLFSVCVCVCVSLSLSSCVCACVCVFVSVVRYVRGRATSSPASLRTGFLLRCGQRLASTSGAFRPPLPSPFFRLHSLTALFGPVPSLACLCTRTYARLCVVPLTGTADVGNRCRDSTKSGAL